MALDVIANKTWDEIDKSWDEFGLETWDGWVEFSYALKIYNTSGVKIAEITGDLKNPTLTELKFELLKQGGCGSFSFTLAKPYTQATIDYDYRVEIYFFNPQTLFYTGKIINKPIEGTEKSQTYSGYGYFNELEKKIIDTEISPGSDIATEVTSLLDTHITPYTNILKDEDLIDTVGHQLVATIDFEDEYAKEIFNRLKELAVDYKFGVNENRKFYFQAIDTSITHYWYIGKHLMEFHPEEDLSDLARKIIAIYPEVFTDGYRLKVTSEAEDYAGLYDKRFSLPEIVNPFSSTNIASDKTPTTSPAGTGAANLCDGNYATLWASGTNQAAGHYIEVDLGEDKENIAKVVIDSIHETAQEYNAKSVKIEIKPDGGSYTTMLSSDDNIGWKPELTFRPTTGRYVKISLTQPSDEEWKVGEIGIYQLDLTDAQRWTDWKLSTLEDLSKKATARIANIQDLIMNSVGLVPIKPEGKARIFDKDGTKIDDYQITACKYSLSSKGLDLNFELGDVKTIGDPFKELERRIRENENTGVRRSKNLSLSKGFQLSQIKGTYIGKDAIETKHLRALSITADKYYELRNTYVFSDQDSLDASYPFEMDFEIVSEMTAIQKVLLSFRIRNFRAYSTGVPAGGGHTTPAGGGHTTPAGGGHTTPAGGGHTTPSGGGTTSSSTTHDHSGSTAAAGGAHTHGIAIGKTTYDWPVVKIYENALYADIEDVQTVASTEASGDHSHGLNIIADGAHTHSCPNHTHQVSDHQHAVSDHTHTVSDHTHTVSNHTHSLSFGIYEDAQSPTITVKIDNGGGYGASIGSYDEDQLDIDITSHISGTGFKRIKFESDKRTRISGWVLCKIDLTA